MNADQIDLLDFGDFAFNHVEHNTDAVALQLGDSRRDGDTIFSARHILSFQFLGRLVQRAFIKNPRFGQPREFHAFLELVLGKILGAIDFDTGDRRPFQHLHDQHAAIDLQLHILEKARGIQGAYRGSGLRVVQSVADLDRQVTEHRARFGALYALDANVLDGERLDCPSRRKKSKCNAEQQGQPCQLFCDHLFSLKQCG